MPSVFNRQRRQSSTPGHGGHRLSIGVDIGNMAILRNLIDGRGGRKKDARRQSTLFRPPPSDADADADAETAGGTPRPFTAAQISRTLDAEVKLSPASSVNNIDVHPPSKESPTPIATVPIPESEQLLATTEQVELHTPPPVSQSVQPVHTLSKPPPPMGVTHDGPPPVAAGALDTAPAMQQAPQAEPTTLDSHESALGITPADNTPPRAADTTPVATPRAVVPQTPETPVPKPRSASESTSRPILSLATDNLYNMAPSQSTGEHTASTDFYTPRQSMTNPSSPITFLTETPTELNKRSLSTSETATTPTPTAPHRSSTAPNPLTSPVALRRMSAPDAFSISPMSTPMMSPRKLSAVLHSPPMPQPIAHLPSLQTAANRPAQSPGWGSLAREGGPKSPALSLSRASSRASGSGSGFPFFSPTTGAGPSAAAAAGKGTLTDAEIRKATKSMPVMLHVPSRQQANVDEGGEAEDDDDDDDDEDTSSEDVGRRASGSSASGALAIAAATAAATAAVAGAARAAAHLKGKAVAGNMTPVEEQEAEGSTTPSMQHPQGSLRLQLHNSIPSGPVMGSPSPKSVWNLATPTAETKGQSSQWALFESPQALVAGPSTRSYFGAQPAAASETSHSSSNATHDEAITESRDDSRDGTPSPRASSAASLTADDDDDNDTNSVEGSETDGHSMSTTNTMIVTPSSPMSPAGPAPMYLQTTQSMINLPSTPRVGAPLRAPLSPVNEGNTPLAMDALAQPKISQVGGLLAPPTPTLKRRRSMGDVDPPKYESMPHHLATGPTPKPRDEEGREPLPPYWCGVHIEGTLSRKMEFIQPGVQAKDRGWKKHYFVLHGTALYVYKFDPCKVPLRQGEPYLTCSPKEVETFLHVHKAPDRRATIGGTPITPTTPRQPTTPVRHSTTPVRSTNFNNNSAVSLARPTPTTARVPPNVARPSTPSGRRATIGEVGSHHHRLGVIGQAVRRGTMGNSTPSPPPIPTTPSAPTRRQRAASAAASSAAHSSGVDDAKNAALFQARGAAAIKSVADSDIFSTSSSAPIASHLPFAHNCLIHIYSLQGAESGLAADYKKRLHCVRIRAEGQQFMLQTDTARQCVQWIEAFQAATNVAMDLDTRPMPVQQTLPRRRRRPGARRAPPADPAAPPTSDSANPAFSDTPEGNIAAVQAAERAERERVAHERDRMLAEDQAQAAERGHGHGHGHGHFRLSQVLS